MEPNSHGKTRRAEREENWVNLRAGKTSFDLNFVWSPIKSNLVNKVMFIWSLLKNSVDLLMFYS